MIPLFNRIWPFHKKYDKLNYFYAFWLEVRDKTYWDRFFFEKN